MSENLHNFDYKKSFIDQESGAQIGLTNLHAHEHRGRAFQFSKINISLADNAHVYAQITTPESDSIHFKNLYIWISEGPVEVSLFEDPTLTTGTTPIPIKNKNRNKLNSAVIPSGSIIFSDPTGISGGEELESIRFGINGQGSQSNESLTVSQDEWVMEKGSNLYLLDLQNLSGGAIDTTIKAVWYE